MTVGVGNSGVAVDSSALLETLAAQTKVFVSMPAMGGITPRILRERGLPEILAADRFERLYGTFRADEIGLSVFDRGFLYGDAVFEGILLVQGQLFRWREHLERLYASAESLSIGIPYAPTELTNRVLEAIQEQNCGLPNYLRLIITRGCGDLGIHPRTPVGCTVCCIISTIRLYPESYYERGLDLALSRRIRRASANFIDPRIKSCNYLNNIAALLETNDQNCQETLMLTPDGFVAEATADNIFVVSRSRGWEHNASRIILSTPGAGCLQGITRQLVIGHAKALGFVIDESESITPDQLMGSDKEVFLTGTAAGIIPVVSIDHRPIGDGVPGPITNKFRALLLNDISDPCMGLPVGASPAQVEQYLVKTSETEKRDCVLTPDFISALFHTIDSQDWDSLNQFFANRITYERPGYPPLLGIERVDQFYRQERVIASGQHHLEGVLVDSSKGASWGRFVGKHKNGSSLDERFSDVYTFHLGKILTRRSFFYRPAV